MWYKKYDVNRVLFSFLLDESTNNQVKKQNDGYVSYWSPRYGQVVSASLGSLFVGNWNADDLIEHYKMNLLKKWNSNLFICYT